MTHPYIPGQLLNDIEHYSRKNLRSVQVNYASVDLKRENTVVPYHGFVVIGNPLPAKLRVNGNLFSDDPNYKKREIHRKFAGKRPPAPHRERGKVYTFVEDLMKAPYEVTPLIIEKANALDIKSIWKKALAALASNYYPTQEYFVRALIIKKYELQKQYLSIAMLEQELQFLSKDLRALTYLNYIHYDRYGSYTPKVHETKTTEAEYDLFRQNKTVYHKIDVSTVSLQEELLAQQIYSQYLDEKLAIGKSVTEEYKLCHLLRNDETEKYTTKWVAHVDFPKNPREANCNSSLSTFLQAAINREKKQSSLTYQNIPAPTLFAFSKNARMQYHNPLIISECIDALKLYIKKRRRYGDNFWGKLTKMTKDVKCSATEKMILVLQQRATIDVFSEEEVAALNQGRLQEIIDKYPHSSAITDKLINMLLNDQILDKSTRPTV